MTTIPFGKFKGKLLTEVPLDYLKWGEKQLQGPIAKSFTSEIIRRASDVIVETPFQKPHEVYQKEAKRDLTDLVNKAELTDLIFGKNTTENIVSIEIEETKATLFIETGKGVVTQEYEYKPWILINRPLDTPKCSPLEGNQYYKYKLTLDDVENFKTAKQKLYARQSDFYTMNNLKEQFMVETGFTYFKGMQIKDISVLSFDIETSGLVQNGESEVYLISNTLRKNGKVTKKLFTIEDFESSAEMIDVWAAYVQDVNPSIMLGHNIFHYDLPYMQHCHRGDIYLGRDTSALRFSDRDRLFRKDGSQSLKYFEAFAYGRELIDTLHLAYHYDVATKKYESYGLKNIIRQEGLEKQDRTFIDASKIRQYYENRKKDPQTWQKVKDYALDDSEDALKLFDLMGPAYFYITQSVPKSFQEINNSATGSQINSLLVRSYLQNGHSVAKSSPMPDHTDGGISFAVPGVYRNLYKVDIKSCYPSQVLRFKLHDKRKDPDANFYKMVNYFTQERFELKQKYKETKEQLYKDRDGAAKIFINSAYGMTITNGLNYNAPEIGAKITAESRAIIDKSLRWASGEGVSFWMDKFNKALGKNQEESEDE